MGSEAFELTRFRWATPDTVEIDGRFIGLGDEPTGDAVLVVQDGERTHRLEAVTNGDASAEADGGGWHAAFMWSEAPTEFDSAQLELGDDLLVELPLLRLDDDGSEPEVIDVRRRGPSSRLSLQVELISARSLLGEMESRLSRCEQDLTRARDDLTAEQAGRAADAEQFRAALEQTRASAEEEVTAARADAAGLRSRVDELARVGEEAEQLRGRLSRIRAILGEGDGRDSGGDAASR
jgi:hypothetical protein